MLKVQALALVANIGNQGLDKTINKKGGGARITFTF